MVRAFGLIHCCFSQGSLRNRNNILFIERHIIEIGSCDYRDPRSAIS